MPLIILSGYPSSGKTTLAKKLKEYFVDDKHKDVHMIGDNEKLKNEKNEIYCYAQKEKILRSSMKAEVTRLVNNDSLVIMDAMNYIKGFRYELYCISKQHKTTHCVVQTIVSPEHCWAWNENRTPCEQYSRPTFDALIMRFEGPDSRNRWDSPFFSCLPDEVPALDSIHDALYGRKAPPPNQSTQLQPLSSNNFLYELDKNTKEVVSEILSLQNITPEGEIKLSGINERINLSRKVSLAELSRTRRQFIAYAKTHLTHDSDSIRTLFVQYINKTVS